MITDSFAKDFEFIYNKVKNRDHFSFSKFADGEYMILRNEEITHCDNWTFNPTEHFKEQQLLLDSFQYEHEDYYVGISCPCCQPHDHIKWMRDHVGTQNVTWANLFVNANYPTFLDKMIPEFATWEGRTILVANEAGQDRELPFKVDEYVPCNMKAFLHPYVDKHFEKLFTLALEEEGQLILFSAGPLGNMLAHQLHLLNKKNTYLDIGSTINPWIVGPNRGYLNRPLYMLTSCQW